MDMNDAFMRLLLAIIICAALLAVASAADIQERRKKPDPNNALAQFARNKFDGPWTMSMHFDPKSGFWIIHERSFRRVEVAPMPRIVP